MTAPRDRALILLCAHGGLRIEEALQLTWNDLDLPGGVLTVQHGKGGKTRRVTLTRTLIAAPQVLPREGAVIGGTQTAARRRLQVIANRAETRYRGTPSATTRAPASFGRPAASSTLPATSVTAASKPPASMPNGVTRP
ncbi:site-specific integrase (plasmid) [Deinococcus sp. QL22]|nr:site-specific integrase [Deinococcus sp. QL22]UQN09349.1 site-specific integrase [Deinococcus sp. QL22]